MSQGPENTFIRSVHKHLPGEVYHMKNHNVYNGGIADCWYSGSSGDIWIEYKFIEIPKRPKTAIKVNELLSPLQVEWLGGRYEEGRKVFVVVGCKEGGVWFEDREWEYDITAEAFRTVVENRKQIAQRICMHTWTKIFS